MNFLLIPDASLTYMLSTFKFSNPLFGTLNQNVCLYTNDVTPAAGDTTTTYTEAAFTGYSHIVIGNSDWGTATISGGVATIPTGNLTFSASADLGSPVICYGYFVTTNGAGTPEQLLFAQRFDTPIVFLHNGDSYSFPLNFTLQNVAH